MSSKITTRRFCLMIPGLIASIFWAGCATGENPEAKVVNKSIIFKTKAAEGTLNPCANTLNGHLGRALNGKSKYFIGNTTWNEHPLFFYWAVWGYFSGDSKYKGDKRLLEMSGKWLDDFFVRINTRPSGKAAEKWVPNDIGRWTFHYCAVPVIELEQDDEAVNIVGKERIARLKSIIQNILKTYTRDGNEKVLKEYSNYTNMMLHLFPLYLSDWLMNGRASSLEFCEEAVAILQAQQLPNGSYPYRYKIYGDKHCESDTMYYHAVTNRGLYLLWWYSGSKSAENVLKKSVPYYPLVIEPPYWFSSGADIWWKDQWRTFWPQHMAMAAAVANDGENAAIALDPKAVPAASDYFDLVEGAHAYRLMAEKNVKPVPRRDGYIIRDPDIRGLRSRWGSWSNIFTAGSYSFTRMSAMLVNKDSRDALHLARPVFRTRQYAASMPQIETGIYSTLGREGTFFSSALSSGAAAAGCSYSQYLDQETWRDDQPASPWKTDELWLFTKDALCGLIKSTAVSDFKGFEFENQFRFICQNMKKEGDYYAPGNLRFRIWETNFKYVIEERARRFIYDTSKRQDFQVACSDSDRSPEEQIQSGKKDKSVRLPEEKTYSKGQSYFSLVSVGPAGREIRGLKRLELGAAIGFCFEDFEGTRYTAVYNPEHTEYLLDMGGFKPDAKLFIPSGKIEKTGDKVIVPRQGTVMIIEAVRS